MIILHYDYNAHVISYMKSLTFFNHRQCKRLARVMSKKYDRLSQEELLRRLQSHRRFRREWRHDWDDSLLFFRKVILLAFRDRHNL